MIITTNCLSYIYISFMFIVEINEIFNINIQGFIYDTMNNNKNIAKVYIQNISKGEVICYIVKYHSKYGKKF